jgi:Ion channel
MNVLWIVLGAVLVGLCALEVFEGVVLPRRVARPYRFARLYYRVGWNAWERLAELLPQRRREVFLSVFGPLSLLGLFALWAAGIIVGFALMQWAIAPNLPDFGTALYFSGTTFTTLGYGDISPVGPAPRLLAIVEAGSGFGYFALVIGYLPALYQAFSRREMLISMLDARAGSPPAAGRLLLRVGPERDGTLNRFLQDAERWSAELLESQLSYPVLALYRSQHGNQSWLAALTCALDTSALLLTVVEGPERQQARLTFAMARHALVDLALILRRPPKERDDDRLPEGRLRALCKALREGGADVRDDEAAFAKLKELRGLYEPFVAGLARNYHLSVPAIWPETEAPDNWQTSAWMRRAGSLGTLSIDRPPGHFD